MPPGVVIAKSSSLFGNTWISLWPEKCQFEWGELTAQDLLLSLLNLQSRGFQLFSCKIACTFFVNDSYYFLKPFSFGHFDDFFLYFNSLKGEISYQYDGDRTRDDIVNFALRLVGPSVNKIESKIDFDAAKKKSELFFLFSGEMAGSEWEHFVKIATRMQQHEFFYQADTNLAEKFSGLKETQSIRVYKDETSYRFDGSLLAFYSLFCSKL